MKSNEKIILIGAVGSARNVIEQIQEAKKKYNNPQELIGICIDSYTKNESISEIPVIFNTSEISEMLKLKDVKFLYCLYKPTLMEERFNLLNSYKIPKKRFTNFIHPSSYLFSKTQIGNGNIILSNSAIMSEVNIGDFNLIGSNVTIEHETEIGNGNFIAANACIGAKVKIKNHNFIGLNSSIREETTLNKVFVGMHSLVLENFEKTTVYGTPAKNR